MKESYDATETVKVLFYQIEDVVKFADNAAQPYTVLQVLRVVFNLIFDTGQFIRSCEKWQEKNSGDKNWVNFKLHFTKAHTKNNKVKIYSR